MSEQEQDMVNILITPPKSNDCVNKTSMKIQSSATRVSDGSKDTKSDSDHGAATSTETMLKRWLDHLSYIPKVDIVDVQNDNPHVNGGQQCFMEDVHQHAPEFSQQSYLRMRSMEEALCITDYLDPKCNMDYNLFLKSASR